MTIDTSIGLEDEQRDKEQSGFPDEERATQERNKRGSVEGNDATRSNDRNTSADQGNRSGKTNRSDDDSIQVEDVNGDALDARD